MKITTNICKGFENKGRIAQKQFDSAAKLEGQQMHSPDNKDYFEQRAAQERLIAQSASDPCVAAIHNELAERYEERAELADERRPTLSLVNE